MRNLKLAIFIVSGFITTPAFSITWKGKFAITGIDYTPYLAQKNARTLGAKKIKALTQICDFQKGRSSFTQESSNDLCWLSGPEDFVCLAYTTVSCELGNVQPAADAELDGFYFDEKTAAFVQFLKGEATHSILSPYLGGRLFQTVGPVVRTGENTYEREGTFRSGEEDCHAKAKIKFTKLNDGNLLVHASSPERVKAVIFDSCHWDGEVNAHFELKKVKFVD